MEDEAEGARILGGLEHGAGVPLHAALPLLEGAVVEHHPLVGPPLGDDPLDPDLHGEVLADGGDVGAVGVEAEDDQGGAAGPRLVEEEAAPPDPGGGGGAGVGGPVEERAGDGAA